jgi:hypothetical protein
LSIVKARRVRHAAQIDYYVKVNIIVTPAPGLIPCDSQICATSSFDALPGFWIVGAIA